MNDEDRAAVEPETHGGATPEAIDSMARVPEGPTLPGGRGPGETEPETELWAGRTHWKHFAGRIGLWVVANIGFLFGVILLTPRVEWLTFRRSAAIFFGVLLISGLEVVGRRVWLRIFQRRYRLTTQRLFITEGIFSQQVDQMELIRVDDVRLYKTFLDRLFGLGSVAIVSTDATDRETVITGIAEPDKVAETIRSRMRAMRSKSLFIENL